ncbi:Zinc finger, PMZ-type [Sesbania bispinosa]|nr:Zinc finger, PMZ-type [Sesbania bispinosa]
MMEDRGNRVNEGEGEDVNNLKSPEEENACSGEAVPDVYKRISELIDDEIRMLEFDSELDAYNFYCEYAKFKGFAVRKDDVYRDCNRFITMRQLVYNRKGGRNNNSGKWRVGMFESQHNHELTPANMVHLMPAYRGLSTADKAQVNSLHLYGVRTCHTMGLIMGQKDGHSDLGFCKKGLYNHIDKENRAKIEDGDAFAALCYLQAKYDTMFNKVPKAVVTDGDGAMREAIRSVFLGSIHMLCSWHLHQNACENVKNPKFLENFKKLIYANFTPEKFEQEWVHVIEKHGLRNNRLVRKVYDLKRMWATAFFRDNFFVGVRTTSICEGINSSIKRYVQSKNSLVDFLHNFERALNEYRHNELASDFKSTYTQPVLTTALEKYEVHACNVYTRNKFFEIRKEIEKVAAFNMNERSEVGNIVTMKMNKFGSPNSVYVVLFDKSIGKSVCDCRLFESCGLPCSHIFGAMKHEQVESIPPSLICKRWTKFAKVDYIFAIYADEGDTTKKELLRSGAMGVACNRLNKATHKNPHNFVKNIEAIHQLADQMERQDGVDVNIADISRVVRDPTIVKTKGAPHKTSNCRRRVSVESDGESRDVTDTHNHDSLARSKGVTLSGHGKGPLICKKSNKRMKHNDAVKLTQESVNDRPQLNDVANVEMRDCSRSMDHVNHMSHQNIDVNDGFRFIHKDLRFTGTYQYQPSMLPHFGHAQFSSRVHIMPQYPSMPVQQAFRNTTMFHEINTFCSHDP